MKKWFKETSQNISQKWLSNLIKFFLFSAGVVISAFGLALYQQPAVGGSQIDWTLYNILALKIPYAADGSLINDIRNIYGTALATLYIIFIIIAIGFAIKPSIDDYKNSKKKSIWVLFVWMIIADIIITFTVPLLIGEISKGLEGIIKTDNGIIISSVGFRNLLFIAGFLCFVIGTALWVKTGWILGPFNNICTQFLRLTKLNYAAGRLIIDISILAVGFMFFPFIKGEGTKTDFLMTNFGLGTICFTFLVGPLVNSILKILNKICDFEKIDKLTNKSVFEV
ncbi:SPE_1075/MLC_0560 family membrane protein [Spiroplasma endosymbiont of Diplazon laetatorius]|uniref:SPE_1075/MLC_0560 family membrane protein n=1 Tax=Spiroplasma endosymbiont of Diplazon laetatorius TaxID=3066322 RepID=UPI0030CA7434